MVRHQNLRGSVTISPLQAILQSILDILNNHNLINQQLTNEYSIWILMTIQFKSKKHSIIIPQREYKTTLSYEKYGHFFPLDIVAPTNIHLLQSLTTVSSSIITP